MLNGIDISQWQGEISPGEVASSVDFAIVRASYADSIVDPQGYAYRSALRPLGLQLGHYHYAEPGHSHAGAQARFFLDSVGWIFAGEIYALDIEVDHSNLVAWSRDFAQIVKNVTGRPPVLYTNVDFLNRYDWSSVYALGCPLWVASWGIQPGDFPTRPPWSSSSIHQYSSEGHIPGIDGNVDLDVFIGDADDWRNLGAVV